MSRSYCSMQYLGNWQANVATDCFGQAAQKNVSSLCDFTFRQFAGKCSYGLSGQPVLKIVTSVYVVSHSNSLQANVATVCSGQSEKCVHALCFLTFSIRWQIAYETIRLVFSGQPVQKNEPSLCVFSHSGSLQAIVTTDCSGQPF